MYMYIHNPRPGTLPADCPLVFGTTEGRAVPNLSKRLANLGASVGYTLPKLTDVRKAVVTKAADRPEEERAALAAHMCHAPATAQRYVRTHVRRGGSTCRQWSFYWHHFEHDA